MCYKFCLTICCFCILSRKIFEFNKDQVRILLFRECERRGRKLLFDSKAVKKVHLPNSSQCGRFRTGVKTEETRKGEASYVEITNGFGYQVHAIHNISFNTCIS